MLLPFFRTSWFAGALNSATFNSFHNRVEFGTILEGLQNFGGGTPQPPPLGTSLHCRQVPVTLAGARRDSLCSVEATACTLCGSSPRKGQVIYLFSPNFETGCQDQPGSNSVSGGRGKAPHLTVARRRHDADRCHPGSAKVNEWSCVSSPPTCFELCHPCCAI